MDFLKQHIILSLFLGIAIVCNGAEISIKEAYDVDNDGIVAHGSNYNIQCSVKGLRPGFVAVWYKKQGNMFPIVVGFNEFMMDIASKERFAGGTVFEGEEGNEELVAYVLAPIEGRGGARYSDSGEYGCAISVKIPDNDDDHTTQDIAWTTLTVLDEVDELNMYSVNKDEVDDPIQNHEKYVDGQEVAMDPGQEIFFMCQAKGSYPKPELRVYHSKRDITDEYELKESERTVENEDIPGSAAYHHIVYDVTLTSKYPLKIEEEHNKRPLTCNATVPGLQAVELTILPVMLFVPEVQCKDEDAVIGEKMVKLKCRVRANPPIDEARYTFKDGDKTKIIEVGERVDSIYMRKDPGEYEDQYVYTLELPSVQEEHIRTYTFKGGNRLGDVTGEVTLKLDTGSKVEGNSANMQKAFSTFTLLFIIAMCKML